MENYEKYPGAFGEEEGGGTDFKQILRKIIVHWPWMVVGLLLGLSVAFIYNRYATRIYETNATLLLNQEGGTNSGIEQVMTKIGWYNPRLEYENEMIYLQSLPQAIGAVKNLPFEISYWSKGNFKTSELYPETRFKVVFDRTHVQPVGAKFFVTPIDKESFKLTIEGGGKAYDFLTDDYHDSIKNDLMPGVYKFYEWIEGRSHRFMLERGSQKFGEEEDFFKFEDPRKLARQMRKTMKVVGKAKGSSAIDISINGENIDKITDFANSFMDVYVRQTLKVKNDVADNTIDFINRQLAEVEDSLTRVENVLQRFRADNRAVNMSAEAGQVYNKLTSLEQRRAEEYSKIKYFDYLLKYLNEDNDFTTIVMPSGYGVDGSVNSMVGRLVEMYSRKATMPHATEINPGMIRMNEEIRKEKERLLDAVRNQKDAVNIIISDLTDRIRSAEIEVRSLPKTERDLLNIERKVSLNETMYLFLKQKQAELGITKSAYVPSARVVEYAYANKSPIKPTEFNNLGMGAILGFLFPALFFVARSFMDNRIYTKLELEGASELPVVGMVGHSAGGSNLAVFRSPRSSIAESFRSLRANISFLIKDNEKPVVIQLTSSISGEGKTFCSINLASVYSLTSKKVVLVGVDLRKPKLFGDFNLTNDVGLSNHLSGQATLEEVIQPTVYENLHLISAGPVPPNPSELIISERFEKLIENLKDRYDIIVLDTPPLGLISDAIELSKYADVNLYITRFKYTRKPMLEYINEAVKKGKINNVGLVLNDFKLESSGYGYGYGYGYSYGYGYAGGGYFEEDKKKKGFSLFRKK